MGAVNTAPNFFKARLELERNRNLGFWAAKPVIWSA